MSTTMLLQVIYMTLLGLLRLTIAEEISEFLMKHIAICGHKS